ncbi:glycogen/starch/alpha-glucan phosphorylase [Helicovermis profundi]|uniref:Alpha-1,4 glucan phosphorylase n=1 Tax=Helicovermis profundi TaxID=3065157 RepID=A0AAU9EEH1_9FIRM|nr:glycogen/starch/alpha-glucan phosphorylase [Clostridia bacterium S502]
MLNKNEIKESISNILLLDKGVTIKTATDSELYYALSKSMMLLILEKWKNQKTDVKKVSYFSAEFLMGRAFSNNLINFGIYDEVKEILEELNLNINIIEDEEMDAGLGNGGLGRLAACFLDSGATLDIPLNGYGIRYEYGLFKQYFENGFQMETADDWLRNEDPWSIRRESEKVDVVFNDFTVEAIPYDMPIIGYNSNTINTLRLWSSKSKESFDFKEFNDQNYLDAQKNKIIAEDISRVLYPNDTKEEGKYLRIRQQYFFSSASLQDLVRKHKENHGSLDNFYEFNKIQLNDTHPAVSIPELIRILIDEENYTFEKALEIAKETFSYTNHTILAEALEMWPKEYFKNILPRIYEIIKLIDESLMEELKSKGLEKSKCSLYRIVHGGKIKMAWLSIYGSKYINGVARLHTNLLMSTELKHWYEIYPEKFQNKTNGITQRRWLLKSNPELSKLITELLGSDEWIKNLSKLKDLEKYVDDDSVIERFMNIKKEKKKQLADFIFKEEGIKIDEDSLFDVQIKRLHEYKRQLLNAFHILDLYYKIKENPNIQIEKRTFIFGAKAAPGYDRAKAIIKFINDIASLVNNDKDVNGKIKVVFVHNYRVTYGEYLFPAAELSEQISTAGKEASGTGNMKFMLNGAPTIGTYDGANIEIVEEAGEDNNFIFGAKVEELDEIMESYDPKEYYEKVEGLKKVVDTLIDGTFSDGGSGAFEELYDALLQGYDWHRADNYFILKDFESYREAQKKVDKAYKNKKEYAKKSWMNIANAGKFSSDRTIREYSKDIWEV